MGSLQVLKLLSPYLSRHMAREYLLQKESSNSTLESKSHRRLKIARILYKMFKFFACLQNSVKKMPSHFLNNGFYQYKIVKRPREVSLLPFRLFCYVTGNRTLKLTFLSRENLLIPFFPSIRQFFQSCGGSRKRRF